jgi:hypothetical protein
MADVCSKHGENVKYIHCTDRKNLQKETTLKTSGMDIYVNKIGPKIDVPW